MIESKELNKLNKDLNNIGRKLFEKVNEVPIDITKRLAIGANNIRNTVILSMRDTPKTGITYKRGKKFHIASSPGNPPAIDTGELARSIIFDVRDMEVEVGVAGGAPYAPFLEGGTDRLKITSTADLLYSTQVSNIKPRPFLKPAVLKHHKEIIDDVGEGVFELLQEPFKGK